MKRKKEKDISGCDEQPLWQRVSITTTVYLIKTADILFKIMLLFIFAGTLDDMKRYSNFYGIILLSCLVMCLLFYGEFTNNRVSFKIIFILFILSYWITYGVVLKYN